MDFNFIAIGERKIGDYLINVVAEPDALSTDTYPLEVEALVDGETISVVLAEDVPISDIPRVSYVVRSTEIEIKKIIPVKVKIEPVEEF